MPEGPLASFYCRHILHHRMKMRGALQTATGLVGRRVMWHATIIVVLSGCALRPPSRPISDRHTITARELSSVNLGSSYDAVARLRPLFLAPRSRSSVSMQLPTQPNVFVDGVFMGGVQVLHQLPVDHVVLIRYFSAKDATTKHGIAHPAGTIEVTTKRGRGAEQ
jgi:hypothetical protein